MPTYTEKRRLPYSAEQMFVLAADVEAYPQFLPWCTATRIKRREGETIYADMVIGFKIFREKFTTKAVFDKPSRIDVEYLDGPFKYLKSHWEFEPDGEGACEVDFHIDFEFRSVMLQKLIGKVFDEAVHRMVDAFQKRAESLYKS